MAHACFSLIFDIAQSGIDGQAGGPNDMRLREQLGDKAQWRRISEGAEASIQELDSWMHADGRIMMV